MATQRKASAIWEGGLTGGKGSVTLESSGMGSFDVSWPARAEAPGGLTSPEELVAAAHASCYAMALSHAIGEAGGTPTRLDTSATVTFGKVEGGFAVTRIELAVRGQVKDMDEQGFLKAANAAKDGCPISQLVKGNTEVALDAALA
ncbi:MAG: OsmC family peroxiredoxin [Egibacteraceae bacterium]